eukprot:CCRYP_012689-RA/>CCRYP_012689-RA protein AED:0.18 eAED:0.18 QI:228/1/1/1/0/0/2/201/829
MHSNPHHSFTHSHRERSQQHQQSQQPHRYNRTAFPSSACSPHSINYCIPSSSTMSTSSSSFTDYASSPRDGSNPPSPDSALNKQCCLSDDISKQSAILLYQAFAGGHDISRRGCTDDNEQRNAVGSAVNYRMRTDSRHLNSGRDPLDSEHLRCSDSNGASHDASPKKRSQEDDSHETSFRDKSNEKPKNQSNAGPVNSLSNNDNPDEESIHSKTPAPSQSPPTQSAIFSLLTRHRTKIGTLLISLTSLWLYSKYKKKMYQHRRRGNDPNQDLFQKKIMEIYKLLLQMMSRLRISSYFRHLSSTRNLVNGSSTTKAVSSASPWDQATTTPLAHLLAVAKGRGVSKVMLRGSVLSYLHSIQSSSSLDGGNPNQSMQQAQQRWSKTTLPSNNPNFLQEILSTILNHGCHDITTLPESLLQRFLNGPALVIFPFAYLGALYWIMRRLQRQQLEDGNGENDNTFTWNKNGAVKGPQHTTTFDDVAGIDSALQELSEVVSYMRNPNAFHAVGASPPRGILLHGPPGSGKTLLARAIAGEAGRRAVGSLGQGATIDCFAVCSGSDFVETYVGRGAARVRALFRGVREEAWNNFERRQREFRRNIKVQRKNSMPSSGRVGNTVRDAWDSVQYLLAQRSSSAVADGSQEGNDNQISRPMAIIFIDEIDALAKRRDSGSGLHSSLGGCDEREQTLNQLLTEMDGFATGSSTQQVLEDGPSGVVVIVIAATNRPEVLDPAILRAGRFDRHVQVPLPDANGREAILRVHARRIRYDPSSVDFRELAFGKQNNITATASLSPTHNFSGADLKNVVNEAALLAVRDGSTCVKQQHLAEAVKRI